MKKVVFSGIQPTGDVTIGNYIGAIKMFLKYQGDEFESFFCIVDLHALSGNVEAEKMQRNIINLAKTYLALGLDPKKVTIFQQSMVPAHSELMWILNTVVPVGQLERMTQYKSKSLKDDNFAALLNYPILMAADILLYRSEIVPIGQDQKQHLELTRDICEKINANYGLNWPMPDYEIDLRVGKIFSLSDPSSKMSKSGVNNSYISLLDFSEAVEKKIKSAVTDSFDTVRYDPKKQPGVSNLMVIMQQLTGLTFNEIEVKYVGNNYGVFKKDLIILINEFLIAFQQNFESISDKEVIEVLEKGAKRANKVGEENLKVIQKALGIRK